MDSLSQEQVEEFTQAFLVFDSTNKGHINRVDLAKVIKLITFFLFIFNLVIY